MKCPDCGKEMTLIQRGWTWEDEPAICWHCSGTKPDRTLHWREDFVTDLPWECWIGRWRLLGAYIRQYGGTPVTGSHPPDDFAVQPRLF
jgi:hypothetical protein